MRRGLYKGRRDTVMTIRKGFRAYILDDSESCSWLRKSASLLVDTNQMFEVLKDLGSRLKLRSGWRFSRADSWERHGIADSR